MRAKLISILVFLCLLLQPAGAQAQADPVSELIQRVNALRRAYGVPEYQVDYALMAAAQAQAEWGLANLHFGHDGPGGSSPDDRAKAAGYGAGQNSFTIENVNAGTASLNTPELVVTMWQGDWGHLNAMISADYEHVGAGFATTDDFSFYVMMVGWVGSKASSRSPQEGDIPSDPGNSEEGPSIIAPFILSEPDDSGAIYHEVQPGQSAWTIADQYGIELAELFELNNLTENSILHPGDVLVIRLPDPPTSTPTITSTAIPPTDIPTKSPTAVQAIEAPVETAQPVDQNQADGSASSNGFATALLISFGLIFGAGALIFLRNRKT